MRKRSVNQWLCGMFGGLMLVALIACPPVIAQDAEEETDLSSVNFGRQARESTPILTRDPGAPLNERERIHHVLSRFTMGPTAALMDEVEKKGLENWFREQLKGDIPEPRDLVAKLKKDDTWEMTTKEILVKYNPPIPPELSLSNRLTRAQIKQRRDLMRMNDIPKEQLKDIVLLMGVYSPNQVREASADLWRNHFNIDCSKGRCEFYTNTYERDVIRAEALGSFRNMFFKQAHHPAMLVYLDNFISRAVPKQQLMEAARAEFAKSRDYAMAVRAIDIAKMRGLNENYGRELMELHTLGVDNYYTQDDVITLAEAITGWTVQQDPDKGEIEFQFRPDMHQSANRRLLKMPIPANPRNPVAEGQAALELLARHRGTSEFIAYKLCRQYVNDNPSPHMVRRIAEVYRKKQTSLPEMYLAMIRDEEFYNPNNYQTKFKRPFEFVCSALRILDADVSNSDHLQRALLTLNEPLYQCEDPTGYYDQADCWRDPGVMAARWQFGIGLAMGWIKGVEIPESYWAELEPNNPLQWKDHLAKKVLPGGYSEQTSQALDNVIAKYAKFNPRPDQLGRYIVGILLGSPEFQRQ